MAKPPIPPPHLKPPKFPKDKIENYESKYDPIIFGLIIGFFAGIIFYSLLTKC